MPGRFLPEITDFLEVLRSMYPCIQNKSIQSPTKNDDSTSMWECAEHMTICKIQTHLRCEE